MEGNDIGITYRMRYACKFEGLLMSEEVVEGKKKLFRPASYRTKWVVNEYPMKSLLHLTQQMGVSVLVVSWLGLDMEEEINDWLIKKGAHVNVRGYDSVFDFVDDFKFDREIRTFYTADEEDARIVGIRSTVVPPDRTWGF